MGKRVVYAYGLGLAGVALTVGLTLGAIALAGSDLSEPAAPIVPTLRPIHTPLRQRARRLPARIGTSRMTTQRGAPARAARRPRREGSGGSDAGVDDRSGSSSGGSDDSGPSESSGGSEDGGGSDDNSGSGGGDDSGSGTGDSGDD